MDRVMKQRLADNISLVAQSPGLVPDDIEVVITTPTFRRPDHIIRTLDTLKAQKTHRKFACIVMENEAEQREGAEVCAPLFEDGTYHGVLVIAHDRGNCNAYNAGWLTAVTMFPNLKYLLVIDDDELAEPDWIERMCSTAEVYGADLVGGPQLPIFEGNPPIGWQRHPVFTPHYCSTGLVDIIYSSGNLLVTDRVLAAMPQPWFDVAFNFTGGGDSDLLRRSKDMGFIFAWCQEGIVRETVPERRVTWDWIQKRSLRNGQLSAQIAHLRLDDKPLGRLKVVVHSLALLAASPFRAGFRFLKTGSVLSSVYPVHIALGRVLSEFGYANEQYRNPEKN